MLTLASPTNNACNMKVGALFQGHTEVHHSSFRPTGKINTALMYLNTIN